MRSSRARYLLATAVALVTAARSGAAEAVEIENVGGETLSIDITNTAVFAYHFDNRNLDFRYPGTGVDDKYGEFLDRLNIQVGWWRLRLGVRLDTATYFDTLEVKDVPAKVDTLVRPNATAQVRLDKENTYYNELHSRFVSTYYPSKLFLGYAQPGIDATVGDFYAQLGRGLVFSVRKIDELALDTTVRGGKLSLQRKFGPVSLGAVGFAGQMNPLRIDETSGRRLNGTSNPLFFGFPTAGRELTTFSYDDNGQPIQRTDVPRPNYVEDTVYGAHIEGGTKDFVIGMNGAMLVRPDDEAHKRCLDEGKNESGPIDNRTYGLCAQQFPLPATSSIEGSRVHNVIRNISGSIHFPSILKHGDFYLEVAGQQMANGLIQTRVPLERLADQSGYAVYANASIRGGPVSVALEGKHYRSFFPLTANVDTTTKGFGAPEYSLVAYSQLPTAEPIFVEPVAGGAPNNCVSGGRANVDFRFTSKAKVYAWLGHYVSWSELGLNEQCNIADSERTNTWDYAAGTELELEGTKSHANVYVGARTTDMALPRPDLTPSEVFYREGYVRYDLVKHIAGPVSVQLQGVHRRRYEPAAFDDPWTEGENYTAIQWSPHIAAIFGYEYLVKVGCQSGDVRSPGVQGQAKEVCHYFNGKLQWRSSGKGKYVGQLFDTASVFVGQQRGALRCVSGVCRQFPPFEGAKVEVVSRF